MKVRDSMSSEMKLSTQILFSLLRNSINRTRVRFFPISTIDGTGIVKEIMFYSDRKIQFLGELTSIRFAM